MGQLLKSKRVVGGVVKTSTHHIRTTQNRGYSYGGVSFETLEQCPCEHEARFGFQPSEPQLVGGERLELDLRSGLSPEGGTDKAKG
jgi:hypothetical protein